MTAAAEFEGDKDAAGMVGRSRELGQLQRAIESVSARIGSVAVVRGEPGVGKSRLVREATARAGGVAIAYAECFEGEQRMPFRCWREIFGALGIDDDEADRVLSGSAGGSAADRLADDDDSDLARLRAFDAIVALVRAKTGLRPWVLVFEDLHWADPSSLGLLRHLVRRARGLGICIVATYRHSEVPPEGAVSRMELEIRERRLGEIIDLAGLSTAESLQLARARGLPEFDEDPSAVLHERTGGNAFFIEELVRHLRDNEASPHAARPIQDLYSLPPAVSDVVWSRIVRRSAGCIAALRAAAVVGLEFDARAIEEMLEPQPEGFDAALREAKRAGLVSGAADGSFRFVHALVRETVLGQMDAATSRQLHLAAASLLESRGAAPEILTGHYRLAHCREHAQELMKHATVAILAAANSQASDESREMFELVLRELDSLAIEPLTRARFLAGVLPPIFQRVGLSPDGLHDLALGAAEQLFAAGDEDAASMFVVAYWPLVISDSLVDTDPVKGLELMQKVRDLTGDPYAISCDAHAPFAHFMMAEDSGVPAIAARLRARSDFPGAGAGAILCDAAYAANRGRTDAASSGFQRAWEQTIAISPSLAPAIVGEGGLSARWAAEVWMRFRAPARECELAERELPLKRQAASALKNLRLVREVARREQGHSGASFSELTFNDPFRPDWPHLRLLNLAFREGRWAEAFETGIGVLPRIQPAALDPRSMLAEQLAEWRRHWDPAGARSLLASWQFEHELPLVCVSAHSLAGLIAAELGDVDAVRRHARRARAAMTPGDDWLGLGARVELLEAVCCAAGNDDGAAERLAAALCQFQRLQHPWDEADALHIYGTVLARLGRAGEAATHFRTALTILRRIGAAEAFVQRVQDGGGIEHPLAPAAGRPFAQLTSREADVLMLLMEGRSNREIAAALVVSEATVATHVRHVLEKTATANRTEAVALALRHGFAGEPSPRWLPAS